MTDNVNSARFTSSWYLPGPARRVVSTVVVIIVVVLTIAFGSGHGEAAVVVLGAALLSAATAEAVRVVLRALPRRA